MNQKTILCVDDEINVLRSLKRLLRNEDYQLITANSGTEGLAVLAEQQVSVVISDQRMPEMTGTEFLSQVKEKYPECVRVVLSGYADAATILDSINKGAIYRFLTKPWNDEEIRITIRQCLRQHELLEENRNLTQEIKLQNAELSKLNQRLEDLVGKSTQSLHFSQEVLASIPIPVIGISAEGIIVLVNEAVDQMFPELRDIHLGSDIKDAFSNEIYVTVSDCLSGTKPVETDSLDVFGRQVLAHCKRLTNGEELRGCVLALEEKP
ncbi:response regulator [Gimesia aquarii]|uniref:Hydrogenase transcriptional regulatory protein hupR1 n=1 Tax=Gimesia aquarii TaxID=2527964 RepID=A0A517WZX7_9PLAN|nr:response regulator [Gimesia aquarii]QDU10800.1 Hydrogenase transcriptional regulatory protein hupR1 [Gimesia aquarii]